MKVDRQLGFLLLGVWLVAQGLSQLVRFSFEGMNVVLGVLALAAGALLIIRK
jgi:hypothetical protein